MKCYRTNGKLLFAFIDGRVHVLWLLLSPPPIKAVQVVVPDEGDGGENDRRQREVGQGQTKQEVEIALAVGIGHPDQHKNLKNVENDGNKPGADSPTGDHAVERRMKVIAPVVAVQFDRVGL